MRPIDSRQRSKFSHIFASTDFAGNDWTIIDTSRSPYNVATNSLYPDTAGAEFSEISIDRVSNGFKCRSASVGNASGATYALWAFASNPFKNSLAF